MKIRSASNALKNLTLSAIEGNTMAFNRHYTPQTLALSLLASALTHTTVCAQTQPPPSQQGAPQRVEPITVSARSAPVLEADAAEVGGFDAPLAKTPQSISVLGADLLAATGTRTLSSTLKLDASLADNYNAAGYIESLSVRGFVLDQTNNVRRNGLANSNYAPIALENKERIEVLKGVAGLQAGVGAPGGLVNFVTKQPLRDAFTVVNVAADRWGDAKLHVDHNTRISDAGVRINVATETLDNVFDRARGNRQLVSAAIALPITANTSASVDLEHHRQSQPSVPGLGLLDVSNDGIGDTLPDVHALWRLNLNNQSWSLPVVSRTTQATAKLSHTLNTDWKIIAGLHHFATRIDDRIAFPDGCSSGANYVYPGLCGNGDVDVYDFRNDGEKRTLTSFEVALNGRARWGASEQRMAFSMAGRNGNVRPPRLGAYNYAGTTNVFAPIALPANPALESVNTQSDENTLELGAKLHSKWGALVETFAGVRALRAKRSSVRTDGTEAVRLSETAVLPSFGALISIAPALAAYAQFSQGVENESVPNRADRFINFGAQLKGAKSDQVELGLKWQVSPRLLTTLSVFNIEKPFADDRIEADGRATRIANAKTARHRGVELSAAGRVTESLSLQASATYLDARFTEALTPSVIDQRVTNVPRLSASLFADYKIAALPGLSVNALLWLQQGKTVDAFGTITLPRALQLDSGASYQTRIANRLVTTRLNVENVTNRAYWREAPTTSWGGTYLFASAPRNVKLSVSAEF